jgi:hypothetical protein
MRHALIMLSLLLSALVGTTARAEECTRNLTSSASSEMAQFYRIVGHDFWPSVYFDIIKRQVVFDYAYPQITEVLKTEAAAFMAEPGNPEHRKLIVEILDWMKRLEQYGDMHANLLARIRDFRNYVTTCTLAQAQRTPLQGTWIGQCQLKTYGDDMRWSERLVLTVSGRHYSSEVHQFERSTDCTGSYELFDRRWGTVHPRLRDVDWIEEFPGTDSRFSIFEIEGDRLLRGSDSGDRDGTRPERRHATLVDPASPLVLTRTK